MQLINVNPQSGYATVETVNIENCGKGDSNDEQIAKSASSVRSPSPSGGSVTVKEEVVKPLSQPIFKATLLPFNNVLDKIKSNFSNFSKKENKICLKNIDNDGDFADDAGDYVTIADVRNNNEKAPIRPENSNSKNYISPSTKSNRETEYVSLNELPCNAAEDVQNISNANNDSLERKRRQGARVMLDAEGKVVYTSDSLRRRKGAHTTFEPGPYVKEVTDLPESPLPSHRIPKSIRPVHSTQERLTAPNNDSRPLSPQLGKVVIRAASGISSPTAEIVRVPPSTIVTPTIRPISPKPNNSRGAYVHMQDTRGSLSPSCEKGKTFPFHTSIPHSTLPKIANINNINCETKNNNFISGKIKRSDSYRLANCPSTKKLWDNENKNNKVDLEDLIEKEIAAELWRERINYPPTVSPKLCERQCHFYSQAHARELLLASPNRVTIPKDSSEHRARVLSASTADTEIW